MGRIVIGVRRLRFEWQAKTGEKITMREAAQKIGLNKNRFSDLELGKAEAFSAEELIKLCAFFSEVLERPVEVGEIVRYEPNNKAVLVSAAA